MNGTQHTKVLFSWWPTWIQILRIISHFTQFAHKFRQLPRSTFPWICYCLSGHWSKRYENMSRKVRIRTACRAPLKPHVWFSAPTINVGCIINLINGNVVSKISELKSRDFGSKMPIHAPFVRFWCHNGKTETFIELLFLQECNNRGLAYMNQTVYKSVLRFSVGGE